MTAFRLEVYYKRTPSHFLSSTYTAYSGFNSTKESGPVKTFHNFFWSATMQIHLQRTSKARMQKFSLLKEFGMIHFLIKFFFTFAHEQHTTSLKTLIEKEKSNLQKYLCVS